MYIVTSLSNTANAIRKVRFLEISYGCLLDCSQKCKVRAVIKGRIKAALSNTHDLDVYF